MPDGPRRLHRRLLVDPHRPELHRHDPPHARARHDVVPAAAVRLGALRDEPDPGAGHAGHRHHDPDAVRRARVRLRHLRSRARRRPGAVPAPLLVLLAPGGLHHDPAGARRHERARRGLLARRRFSATASSPSRAWPLPCSASSSGRTTCSCRASRSTPRWCSRSSASRSRSRPRSKCSTGPRRSTRARSRSRRRCSTPMASSACSPSAA